MSTALTRQTTQHAATWAADEIQTIREQICPSITDSELKMFSQICGRTGLDPFSRQIYAIKRYDRALGKEKLTVQVSIDGARLIAERSGKYQGQTAPEWYDKKAGRWVDVWLETYPPAAARVGVHRAGAKEPVWGIATWAEYAQTNNKTGQLMGLWSKMGATMIAKCAESLALRKAFPAEMSGLYTREEMGQDTAPTDVEVLDAAEPVDRMTDEQVNHIVGVLKLSGAKTSEAAIKRRLSNSTAEQYDERLRAAMQQLVERKGLPEASVDEYMSLSVQQLEEVLDRHATAVGVEKLKAEFDGVEVDAVTGEVLDA